MRAWRPLTAILFALSSTACARKDIDPRVELVTPDRDDLVPCLALKDVPPTIDMLETMELPDGRRVVLFDQYRTASAAISRYIVELRRQRSECRNAVVSVATFIDEARKSVPSHAP